MIDNIAYENGHVNGGIDMSLHTNATKGKQFSLKDGSKIVTENQNGFAIIENEKSPVLPNNIEQNFGEIASYLKANKDRQLHITGQYLASEKAPQGDENMGVSLSLIHI